MMKQQMFLQVDDTCWFMKSGFLQPGLYLGLFLPSDFMYRIIEESS